MRIGCSRGLQMPECGSVFRKRGQLLMTHSQLDSAEPARVPQVYYERLPEPQPNRVERNNTTRGLRIHSEGLPQPQPKRAESSNNARAEPITPHRAHEPPEFDSQPAGSSQLPTPPSTAPRQKAPARPAERPPTPPSPISRKDVAARPVSYTLRTSDHRANSQE